MSIELYANISIGHENDWAVIEKRIISAAQCNADAIVISKATPHLIIPEEKKYVSINSKWGSKPYIEVAKLCEIDKENAKRITDLTDTIGIPVIWSVTDTMAAEWVKEHANCSTIKIHYDARDNWELITFCYHQFTNMIYGGNLQLAQRLIKTYYRNRMQKTAVKLYHSHPIMPAPVDSLMLNTIDELHKLDPNIKVGYEAKSEGIYPDCAVAFKDVAFIEKHLGDDEMFNSAVLTPQQFYDFFVNVNQLEKANGVS